MKATPGTPRKKNGLSIKDLPETYTELVGFLAPRPIHDDNDAANITEVADAMAGHDLNPDQQDYFDLLCTLIEEYERRTVKFPKRRSTALQRLKYLMQESGMSTADLGRLLGSSGLASDVMHGKRELSKTHIRILSDHFKLDAGYFL